MNDELFRLIRETLKRQSDKALFKSTSLENE